MAVARRRGRDHCYQVMHSVRSRHLPAGHIYEVPVSRWSLSPMRHVGLRVVVALLLVHGIAYSTHARMQYYTQFKKEYLDNHPDKDYAETVNKGTNKCFVCHQGKKSKKNHNPFGLHVVKLLEG